MTDPALMRELDFTPDDLTANRDGRLSDAQRFRLHTRRTRSIATGVAIMLVMAFAASLCIYGGVHGNTILLIIGLGLTLLTVAVMSTFARYWLRLSADIREQTASAFSGTLERVVKPVNRRVVTYLVRVGGAEFSVTKDAFKLFAHEAPYTLYRAKYTGTLLSAEQTGDAPASPAG